MLTRLAHDGAMFSEPVDELDCAVMPQAKTRSKCGNGRTNSFRQSFDSEQQLVLLRLNPVSAGGCFAEVKELADSVAEFGKLFKASTRKTLL